MDHLARVFHELPSREREGGRASPPCEPARQSPEAKPMADGQGEADGPPGNRPAAPRDWSRTVPERYVAGADTRGRQQGRLNPQSQKVIHEISGLVHFEIPFRSCPTTLF